MKVASAKTRRPDALRIVALCDDWRCGDYVDSLDRAEIARHFNGGQLPSACSDGKDGLIPRVNHGLGRRYMDRAMRQLFRLYTDGPGLIKVKLPDDGGDYERRIYVEREASLAVNRIIKKSGKLRHPYRAISGESPFFGTAFLFRSDRYDWRPRYGRPLFPQNAPADTTDERFLEWCFPDEIGPGELLKLIGSHKSRKDEGIWNKGALRKLFRAIEDRHREDRQGMDGYGSADWDDPEAWYYNKGAERQADGRFKTSVSVYWHFQKDEETGHVHVSCVSRHGESAEADDANGNLTITRSNKNDDRLLCWRPRLFDSVQDCLFPFILDFELGGEPRMSRVSGLGHKLFDRDRLANKLINLGFAGAEADLMPLYTAEEGSVDRLQRFLQGGYQFGGVIPSGVEFVKRDNPTQKHGVVDAYLGRMEEYNDRDAQAASGDLTPSNRGRRELEVQALERQNESRMSLAARMTDWLDCLDPLCSAMFKALTNPEALDFDGGWEEVEAFREAMKAKGIALEELERAEATAARLPGDGDLNKAAKEAQILFEKMPALAPAFQDDIKRRLVYAVTGDWAQAEAAAPETERPEPNQIARAQSENAYAVILGIPPQPLPDDIPEQHAQVHDQGLQALLNQGQQAQGKFTPQQAAGFMALAQHQMIEAQRVEMNGRKEMANEIQQSLQRYQRVAQAFAKAGQEDAQQNDPQMIEERKVRVAEQNAQNNTFRIQDSSKRGWAAHQHRRETDSARMINEFDREQRADEDSRTKRATSRIQATANAMNQQQRPQQA